LEWKELNAAACRIMQNYCGEFKSDELLKIGLLWMADLQKNEVPRVVADNPHKLMRTLEVFNILTCNEMILHASMSRKASNAAMGFIRLDHSDSDSDEWKKWIVLRNEDGTVKSRDLALDFWAPLAENYEKFR
jgi:succinate dehydrogenase/fumarate reductase flavoprotein subunit